MKVKSLNKKYFLLFIMEYTTSYTTKTNIFSILKTSPLNSPTTPNTSCMNDINKVPVFSLLEENPKYIEKKENKEQSKKWADISEE